MHEPLICVVVSIFPPGEDPDSESIRAFTARFTIVDEDAGFDDESDLGTIAGWIAWAVDGRELLLASDVISSDAAALGAAASRLIDSDDNEEFISNALLIDRVEIEKVHRGRSLVGPMIDKLAAFLRLDAAGAYLVAMPLHDAVSGEPIPGLVRTLTNAGFERAEESNVYSREA